MDKNLLIDTVATKHDISKTTAKAIVDDIFGEITNAVALGNDVSIHGFGKFTVKSLEARTGRNPRTGEALEIAASKKVGFSAAKQLKDRVNG